MEGVVEDGAHEAGAGDGENPSPDNAARDAPMDGGDALRSADAGDGSSDDVSGADGDACSGRAEERESRSGFGGEAGERAEFGDALAHRFHDAPAAGHSPAGHCESAANNHPIWNDVGTQVAGGEQRRGDDAHALLRVVGTVAEAECGGGEQLQTAKPAVDARGRLAMNDPTGGYGDEEADGESNDWRDEDENHGLRPAGP